MVFSATSGTGTSATASRMVYVLNQYQLPIFANLTFSGANVNGNNALINSPVTISGANSTGQIASYQISYGDGTMSGIINISNISQIVQTKTYGSVGQYSVNLTVYDGANGMGNSSFKSQILNVSNQVTPPANDSLLVKYNSVYIGSGVWRNYWKLNCAKAFGINYSNDCRYRGGASGWNLQSISSPVNGWVYFETEGTTRLAIINMQNGQEVWMRLTPNVNVNDHSLTPWNSFGCLDVVTNANGTFPIYDPGTIGDQLINLNRLSNGKLRINIKACHGTFVPTPGVSPGIKLQYPSGAQVLSLNYDASDPYGFHYYVDINQSDFNNGSIKFWILQSVSQTSNYYYWSGSYFGPNPGDQSFTIPAGINPPGK